MDTEPAQETFLARSDYLGATAEELGQKSAADKLAAGISQKALFQRRGQVTLEPDRLLLGGWGDTGDLELLPEDITSVRTAYTALYGRFIGGLLNSGKPLILGTTVTGEIYLLIDRKEFMETTEDRAWEKRIKEWLATFR
jgi:hypothetical protein